MRDYFGSIFRGEQSQANQVLKALNNQPGYGHLRNVIALIFLIAVFWCIFAFIPRIALAGPPFVMSLTTRSRWNSSIGKSLAAQYKHDRDQVSSTLPHLEINYGAIPNLQIHIIAPLVYVKPEGAGSQYGYGDTELGVKFRFIQETDRLPQMGIVP